MSEACLENNDSEITPAFWKKNVSHTFGKHNLRPDIWEKICKIRSRPIELKHTEIFGSTSKPYTVLPAGCKGYIVDYPEAFVFDEDERRDIKNCPPDMVPVIIHGYEGILCMNLARLGS